jgi:endoglucanase
VKRTARAACIAIALFCVPGVASISADSVAADSATAGGLPADGVPAARLALLARGINISEWFSARSEQRLLGTWHTADDAALIRRLGFTFVRLTASPHWLFNPADPAHPPPAVRYYEHAVRLFLDAGLAVIVDPIHGTSSDDAFEDSLARDPGFRRGVADGWELLARRLAAISDERVFFEVMNEPHISTRERMDASWWPPVQEELAAAIRRGAPRSTIIATGEKWGGIDGLLGMAPLSDHNVVYSFHWYEPFPFTHQGADWAGEIPKLLAGIPYPSSPVAVASAVSALSDPRAKKEIIAYGGERWDRRRVEAGLRRAAEWGKRYGVPVFCGEFGVYRKVSPEADRVRWIADVRGTLEDFGIGWSMWDYDGGFGLIRYSSPPSRAGRILDALAVKALGLTPGAWTTGSDSSGDEIVLDLDPAAGFLSRTRNAVTIPIQSWPRLWSRDAAAAVVTAEEDAALAPTALVLRHAGSRDWAQGSGLRVAVSAGEKFTLSGTVFLEPLPGESGPGTVSLEVVAYDSAGAVLRWDFAAVRAKATASGAASAPGASGMQPLSTTFVIGPGIAAMEPRWSGSGPALVRLGPMRLARETP